MVYLCLSFSTEYSLWASSPGRSGGEAGKGRRACNYVAGIWISASKRLCELLIGGDDISNDVITLGSCFFNVCLRSRSFPLHADWRKSDSSVDEEPQGNWRWNSNFRCVVASSPSFPRCTARAPGRACSQASLSCSSFSKARSFCSVWPFRAKDLLDHKFEFLWVTRQVDYRK